MVHLPESGLWNQATAPIPRFVLGTPCRRGPVTQTGMYCSIIYALLLMLSMSGYKL